MSDFVFGFQDADECADQAPGTQRAPSHEVRLQAALGISNTDLKLLRGASNGMVDKLIAKQLRLSASFVHARWRRIRRALAANDRSHAVAIALSLGLIPPPAQALALSERLRER